MKLTQIAVDKVAEIMKKQEPMPTSLRVSVTGGGCSGFQYSIAFENKKLTLDKEYEFIDSKGEKIKVVVDQASMLYIAECEIDYAETLESTGFKFNNPDVKSTCGCGSSFQV